MADEAFPLAEVLLAPAAEHEWTLLRELVDFADRLVVAFIFADRFAVRVLRDRMANEAKTAGAPFRLVICDEPEALRNEALAAILKAEADREVIWFEAFGPEATLRGAWSFAAQRWNEHREPLRRSAVRALIVAGPPWAKPVIRMAAPDLWSITNLVIEPSALPSSHTFKAPEKRIERLQGSPAERAIADSLVEKALESPPGEERTVAMIEALADAFHAGAWDSAFRVADRFDLEPQALRKLVEAANRGKDKRLLAMRLNNLGTYLAGLGRPETALQVSLLATGLYRGLASSQEASLSRELAVSLSNLGNRLSEVGHLAEAVAVDEEAIAICRQPEGDRATEFRPVLAMILTNLSIRLGELGNLEKALSAAAEASGIYQELAENPQTNYLPAFAKSLNNLGNQLLKVGITERAMVVGQEAVTLARSLVEDGRRELLPTLAATLNNLGNALGRLGRYEDALAAAEESVAITVDLARSRPEAFLRHLELVVRSLFARLDEAKKSPDSSAALHEAQSVLQSLKKAHRPSAEA